MFVHAALLETAARLMPSLADAGSWTAHRAGSYLPAWPAVVPGALAVAGRRIPYR